MPGGHGGHGGHSGHGGYSRNGPGKMPVTTMRPTSPTRKYKIPYVWPFVPWQLNPWSTRKQIPTEAPVTETTPLALEDTPKYFRATTEDNTILNQFTEMKDTTTDKSAVTEMTWTPYLDNGMSSFNEGFKNDSTDFSTFTRESQYASVNNTAVIAAFSVVAALIIVCFIVAVILCRRQRKAKANFKQNVCPYKSDPGYSTRDQNLITISGMVGTQYAKENEYCQLGNNFDKKIDKNDKKSQEQFDPSPGDHMKMPIDPSSKISGKS
ncbi:uncharacterized protein LOC131946446 [Physella acuta]|uniref:uncharacterized protein LOC131946446 n=1 Tax=Physella acuta TaxID=109671 RepID=UPI0027DEAB6C|nr:uncharacterized protein LOC131946446 [Physella acuta]